MMRKRAIFLDRDGVLNRNTVIGGKPYAPRHFADFELFPDVEEAIRKIKRHDFLAIVVTNQPDVASGLTPRAEVDAMHDELRRRLPLNDIKVCWHVDADLCGCRKPKPGLLLEAAAEHVVDLAASYMIGDRWRDIDAGRAAGCRTILIDRGLVQEKLALPDKTTLSLAGAVDYILEGTKVR